MHALGVTAVAIGSLAALAAEAVLLVGALTGKWRVTDVQRDPRFVRWFFSGLGLLLAGAVILAVS